MTRILAETELPIELTPFGAVDAAYPDELTGCYDALRRRLPVLVECEKELAPYVYRSIRDRLKAEGTRCLYLDGRAAQDLPPPPQGVGLVMSMIHQIREVVRGAIGERIVVLPHLDIMGVSAGSSLGAEARELIPLLYENPEVLWLGFKDPAFPLPKPIENLFPHRESIVGIPRDRLQHLITQREARKFGRGFDPYQLYKHVSGVNAVRLRRLLASLTGEDYPANPAPAIAQLRTATLTNDVELPNVSLDDDIGGYGPVKERLRSEILAILAAKDKLEDRAKIARLESLVPRGMIFWGPPGTGKTLFAKAMATALGAAVQVVSGPELKSKWVGESLPWDEEVFVVVNGRARRMPIGELVDGHRHGDDVRTWTVKDDGTALLARVTAFIRHRGPDYIDVLVTETGREIRVTGGHSLFVRQHDKLAEVFADDVIAGETRVAIPLRLEAPQTSRELNLLELLSGREDVQVEGYDEILHEVVESIGVAQAAASGGPAVRELRWKTWRSPLTVAAFQRVTSAAGVTVDPRSLAVRSGNRPHSLPAVMPLTPELGEFLGKWVADGCYATTGVRLACHADEVEQVAALCERLFGHVTRYPKGAKGVDLILNHTLLRRLMLEGLGMQDGSARKRVPSEIFLAPRPVVAAFLRGYFSGDGTFSGKYIEATTVSRALAADVATLLQYFGIVARLRTKREWTGSTSYRVRFLWTHFLRRFADEIGFADEKRNKKLRGYLDGIKLKRDVQTPAAHITNDVLWDRVVEKRREPYTRAHVYDLSVPRTERFIAGFGNVVVHNSEENLRAVFMRARQCAPSVIVFDELDSFAHARGTYMGSGVEHSMVNQLLTEMDGFRREELVFVVGTTNFVDSLDPALLRPGRFEFALHIPYPNTDDRRAILGVHDKRLGLEMTDAAIDYAVKRSAEPVPGPTGGTHYSGDHLQALCRQLARTRLRENHTERTTPGDIDRAIEQYLDLPKLTLVEELVVATHEAGHAVCALACVNVPPIDRISIRGDIGGALGYVKHADSADRYVVTYAQLRDRICTMFGGREAEVLLLDDISIGASSDIRNATAIARALVERYGAESAELGIATWSHHDDVPISELTRGRVDVAIAKILETERARARQILTEKRTLLVALRDLLLERKVLDRSSFAHLVTDG